MATQDSPGRLRNIRVAVCEQIVASGFSGKDDGAAFVNMEISEGRREDRACLRGLSGFWDGQEKLVVVAVCLIFRARPVEKFRSGFIVDEALVERESKKTQHLRLVKTDFVEIIPYILWFISGDCGFTVISRKR